MAREPKIRALLVGINRYTNLPEDRQLHGCVRDTENVRDLLAGEYGVDQRDIRLLSDERATKDAILSRLSQLVRDTHAGEVAVFHVSSHGALVTRREPSGAIMDHASEILCLSNIPATLDDPDAYITDSDLAVVLKPLPPGALVVAILDACHSGATTIARDLSAGATPIARCLTPPPDLQQRAVARRARFDGADNRHRLFGRSAAAIDARVFVLTACGRDQTSADAPFPPVAGAEDPEFEGAFTHCLCDVLRGNPLLSYQDLLTHVQADLQHGGETQTPEFLPASCVERGVFEPLSSTHVPTTAQHLVNRPLEGRMWVAGARTSRAAGSSATAVQVPSIPVTSSDPRLQRVLDQLTRAGNIVQDPIAVGPPPADDDVTRVMLDVPEGYTGMLMEFQDGLVIWHKPRDVRVGRATGETATRDLSAPAPGRKRLEFHVHPLPPTTSARVTQRGLGDLVGRVFNAVLHPVRIVTRLALNALEKVVFHEGLQQYTAANFHDGAITNPSQLVQPPPDGALLFIHGIFSSVDGAFGKPPVLAMLGDLEQKYAVFGYDHLSATVGLDTIAQALDHRLRSCLPDGTRLRIVAHSQGGLIARQLACLRPVDRIITFGSPLRGTHLADGLERWVTVFSNIDAAFPGGVLDFITKLLDVVDDIDVLPGLLDMKVGSDYLKQLDATQTPLSSSYVAGDSEFTPDASDSMLARLAERVEQWAIFPDANDLVVDTFSMIVPPPAPEQDVLAYGAEDHVSHVAYFNQQRTADFLRGMLL